MTWVEWRRQRSIVSAFFLVAVLLAAWLLITGLHEQSLWHQYLSAPCRGGKGVTSSKQSSCEQLQWSIFDAGRYNLYTQVLGEILGPLFGLVLGVTAVASEFERKTTRLAWTQSESRARWLTSKFVVSIASMAIILVPLCFLFSWWVSASHMVRITPKGFPIAGFMGVAYGIFCFALVAALGPFIRRAAWVFAVGLVLFTALFFTMQVQVLPNLVTPSVATIAISQATTSGYISTFTAPADSWVLSTNGLEPEGTKGVRKDIPR